AFAEVILEELAKKHAFGIVTTHYLNLKVMANKTPGIVNGAMAFDEKTLLPLYKLITGKPGSSYTFSIAERTGLDKRLVQRARTLVDEGHFRLDKLLNRAEQDIRKLEEKERELHKLMKENERLKKEMEQIIHKEKHQQQVELLKHQNKISEERLAYLKDMERKLKQIVFDWRRMESEEDKSALIKQMHAMLFKQKEKQVKEKARKRFDARYVETGEEIKPGIRVKMLQNNQVGIVKEMRDKKAIVQLGAVPITVDIKNLVAVQDRIPESAGEN
ncbi:MAG: DNA mismatch repair protein MutS, partial [Chitinophagaceae bacterium]|nr:DNA mismatch repair protein MutS [Chitinophagaceae bacterium]